MGTQEHKNKAPSTAALAIISISSTRSLVEDASGQWIEEEAVKRGHRVVARRMVKDDIEAISQAVRTAAEDPRSQILLLTGGTGISEKDVTIEAVRPLFTKELASFNPLFAQISFGQIGSAALLSRAAAGLINKKLVFCLPGSLNACKLACERLIFPEIGHLRHHIEKG